jgi:uncharacterized protein (TIGR00730 family)
MSAINTIRNVSVFCASKPGNHPVYQQAAEELADAMSAARMTLVYGGANVGLMGVLANRMLKNGAPVVGVITESLVKVEVAHRELTTLHVVPTMHERKNKLIELADAFIMLPGSIGSLDEFFEVYTLSKLRYHHKPFAIVNTAGYYNLLLKQLDWFVDQGFEKAEVLEKLIIVDSPEVIIQLFLTSNIERGVVGY